MGLLTGRGGEDIKAGEEGKTDKSKTILYIVEVCPGSPVNRFPPQVTGNASL